MVRVFLLGSLVVWTRRRRRSAIPPIPEDVKENLDPTPEEWATAVRLAELILGELERRQSDSDDEEGG